MTDTEKYHISPISSTTSGSPAIFPKRVSSHTSAYISGQSDIEAPSFQNKPDVTSKARAIIANITNDTVRNNASYLLFLIQTLLNNYIDITELPPLRAFQAEDDSVTFEWVFIHYRVGFSIAQNSDASGWYLVSDDTAGSIMASGKILDTSNQEGLILWLLQYIVLNY